MSHVGYTLQLQDALNDLQRPLQAEGFRVAVRAGDEVSSVDQGPVEGRKRARKGD